MARSEAATLATEALLAGRTATQTYQAPTVDSSGSVRLVSTAPEDPTTSLVEVMWSFGGTVPSVRRTAARRKVARTSRAEVLRAAQRLRTGQPAPTLAMTSTPYRTARALINEPVGDRLGGGPCACCGRTAPAEAALDRTVAGLCYGCDRWHRLASPAVVPAPGCEHHGRYETPHDPARWWRQDPRTDPTNDPHAVPSAVAQAGLNLEAASADDGCGWWGPGAFDDEVLEAWWDNNRGGCVVSRKRAPWARHMRRTEVQYRLPDDAALHEVIHALLTINQDPGA